MAYIYALVDPRTDEVRYIGQTKYETRRLKQHVCNLDNNAAKHAWIAELKAIGLKPDYIILEEVNWDDRFKRERYWIKHYQRLGASLTNQIVTGLPRLDIQNEKAKEQQERLRKLLEEM